MKFSRNALQFYRGLYFMGTRLQDEPWFAEAFAKRMEVHTRFNPSDISRAILIPPNLRSGQIDVSLTRRSSIFSGFSLSEVTALSSDVKLRNAAAYWENLPRQVELEQQMHAGIKQANRQWRDQFENSRSNAERLRGIKENKREEVESMSAEALGISSHVEPAYTQQQEITNPYQTAVEETASEVEKLLADEMGRNRQGQ